MRRTKEVESARDRVALAGDAGMGRMSLGSVLAGVLVAYGATAILAAIIGGIASAAGVDVDTASRDWSDAGIASAAAVALVLFVSYLYGGYVAGRMARRAGTLNGLMVFVLGILVALGVGAFVGAQTSGDQLLDELRGIGIPTSSDELRTIGSVAGIAALASMLLGSILGGRLGDRWHTKLVRRAVDPTIAPDRMGVRTTDDRTMDDRTTEDRTDVDAQGRTPHVDLRDRNDDRDVADHDIVPKRQPAHAGVMHRLRHRGEDDRPADRNDAERWNPNNTDERR